MVPVSPSSLPALGHYPDTAFFLHLSQDLTLNQLMSLPLLGLVIARFCDAVISALPIAIEPTRMVFLSLK